jgi:hypothetical protein
MKVSLLPVLALGLLSGCTPRDGAARAEEIRRALDVDGLRAWATSLVAQVEGGSTNFAPSSPVYRTLPNAVREIPKHGLVGPTAIGVRGNRVELLWIDSWGDAFEISTGPVSDEQETNSLCFKLASGVYYRDRGYAARRAERGAAQGR